MLHREEVARTRIVPLENGEDLDCDATIVWGPSTSMFSTRFFNFCSNGGFGLQMKYPNCSLLQFARSSGKRGTTPISTVKWVEEQFAATIRVIFFLHSLGHTATEHLWKLSLELSWRVFNFASTPALSSVG
ncbi:hypothetical protein ACH5RR_025772 [Cinchona calisaya]|uniref:Uncharacterized protein n=1 Tax=Cinchona calisaya TaxID=153742 RepID=A0ABD2Z401_9GENT